MGRRLLPLVLVVFAPAACSPTSSGDPAEPRGDAPLHPMPQPGLARGEAAVLLNRTCEGCHAAEAAEWRASLHRTSHTEPAYQRSFAIEPLAFCRRCHAPEGDPTREPPPAVGEMGVGCVTCHVVDEQVLAAPRNGSRANATGAPHPVVRDARFATADACASCHEFAFPGGSPLRAEELMQSTVREHAASPHAAASCASCHMPLAPDGRRTHAFAASRDPEILRASIRASAQRVSSTTVEVTLAPVGVGHALPTRDLFRRLEISAEAFGADNLVVASSRRYLTRHFTVGKGAAGKRLERDDRLTGERTIEVDLGPDADGHPVAWRIGYQRVAHPSGATHEDAVLEDDVELASGVIQ